MFADTHSTLSAETTRRPRTLVTVAIVVVSLTGILLLSLSLLQPPQTSCGPQTVPPTCPEGGPPVSPHFIFLVIGYVLAIGGVLTLGFRAFYWAMVRRSGAKV
jgi:hypothetical protein